MFVDIVICVNTWPIYLLLIFFFLSSPSGSLNKTNKTKWCRYRNWVDFVRITRRQRIRKILCKFNDSETIWKVIDWMPRSHEIYVPTEPKCCSLLREYSLICTPHNPSAQSPHTIDGERERLRFVVDGQTIDENYTFSYSITYCFVFGWQQIAECKTPC